MQINVNGTDRDVTEGITITLLLEELKIKGPVAVELNRQVYPRTTHQDTVLKSHDVLEIVTIVGGG